MIERFDRLFIAANRWTLIVMMAALAVMVFANVALRFATDQSLLWVEELSRYLMIWLTFLGSGLVLRYGGHIGIDTLQDSLPRHAAAIRGVILALCLMFFGFMVWLGFSYALFAWSQTTPIMQVPMGAVYLAMPIGFLLLIAHLLLMAWPYVKEKRLLADESFDADAAKR
jgi:TRAP-type C4-dicarboxylate transport system permease small subunit